MIRFLLPLPKPAIALAGLCLGASLFGCGSAPVIAPDPLPAGSAAASLNLTFKYRVGPGDVLRVNVAGHPDLSSSPYKLNILGSPVDGSGAIQLPYVGVVPVTGMTVFEIKIEVEKRLLKYLKRPSADVAVVEFGSQRIFVLGEVQNPGMFVLDRPITALQALSLTGGFTADANREQIALFQGPVAVDNMKSFNAITLAGSANAILRPNDLIFVGQRAWAEESQMARDLVPILQLISLPVGTARDVALFQDIRNH
jgi:polysaccharide export outer membrane protein